MPLRAQAAPVEPKAANLQVYRNPEVVSHYASLDYLTACERLLFDTYLAPGMAILDLGVGGGRTTPYLSQKASRYVGVDYSEEMISLCRNKFPQLEFQVADAADLSRFPDGSFDGVTFAFNGLDYVLPAEKRQRCLRECQRVLRARGVLIFSSHNPRSIFLRPSWGLRTLRAFARRLLPQPGSGYAALRGVVAAAKSVHALLRALAGSGIRIARRVPSMAFWRGEGCLIDPVHGGVVTHCWTPRHAITETSSVGFRFETLLGDDHPWRGHEFVTDWYYYVFIKESSAGGSCA